MPAIVNINHLSPTFLINRIKGWNTRLIYTYYGSASNTIDYMTEAGSLTDNLFNIIYGSSIKTDARNIYSGNSQWQ